MKGTGKTNQTNRETEQKKPSAQKRNNSSSDRSRSKRQRLDRGEDESQDTGVQHHEIWRDECAACFGLYEDDANLMEWIE